MTKNRNVGLLLIATLLTIGMSGIVGASYDEDGNYFDDVVISELADTYYVAEPLFSYDIGSVATAYAEIYELADTYYVAEPLSSYDIPTVIVDTTVSGIQEAIGEE